LDDVKYLLLNQTGFFADPHYKVPFRKSHSFRLFWLLTISI
jgi:hypothetical protein